MIYTRINRLCTIFTLLY